MFYGSDEIGQVFFEGAEIEKIYYGPELVYESKPVDPYEPGTVLLMVSQRMYAQETFHVAGDGIYELTLAGPGAGGTSGKWSHFPPSGTVQARQGAASGGSGSVFVGQVRLTAGDYIYHLGPAGTGMLVSDWTVSNRPDAWGDARFGDAYAYGGKSCHKSSTGYLSFLATDIAAEPTIPYTIVSQTTNSPGIAGKTTNSYNAEQTGSQSAIGWGIGQGGNAMAVSSGDQVFTDGKDGFIKLVYIGQ